MIRAISFFRSDTTSEGAVNGAVDKYNDWLRNNKKAHILHANLSVSESTAVYKGSGKDLAAHILVTYEMP